ncbi:MAG TPA: ANTAR domain-containing protein [Amycolatopsis sp.]|jgi:hypothetical protein
MSDRSDRGRDLAVVLGLVETERLRAERAAGVASRHDDLAVTGSAGMRAFHLRMAEVHRASERAHRAAVAMHVCYADRAVGQGPEPAAAPTFIGAIAEACGAHSIAVTLFGTRAGVSVSAASDPLAEAAQDLEYVCGEGPAITALTGIGELSLRGGELSRYWPQFGTAVQEIGVVSVVSARLGAATSPLGAITVYQPGPGDNDLVAGSLTAVAEALTNTALVPIVETGDGLPAHPLFDDVDLRVVVHQATGVVMTTANCGAADALALIRAHAFAAGRSVLDVALAIVDRTLTLP